MHGGHLIATWIALLWLSGLAFAIGLLVAGGRMPFLALGSAAIFADVALLPLIWLGWEERFSMVKRAALAAVAVLSGVAFGFGIAECQRSSLQSTERVFIIAQTCWLGVLSACFVALFALLAVLWALGASCCRGAPDPHARKTSESDPLHVDFLDERALLPRAASGPACGRVGMTILPGRKRKESYRDLSADLTRLRRDLHCDVLVRQRVLLAALRTSWLTHDDVRLAHR